MGKYSIHLCKIGSKNVTVLYLSITLCSLSGEGFLYNGLVPLPAQRNLTPPPTLNPQQPVSPLDNYRYHRFSSSSLPDVSSSRTSREDIINLWCGRHLREVIRHNITCKTWEAYGAWELCSCGILNCLKPLLAAFGMLPGWAFCSVLNVMSLSDH
jgi:hypothetical protein